MTHEQLGLVAGQVEARAVGGLFDLDGGRDAKALTTRFRKSAMGSVGIVVLNSIYGLPRAAASVLPPPTRFIRRSVAVPPDTAPRIFGGPIM